MYSIKDTEDSENLEDLALLQNLLKDSRLQDNLGKKLFHENLKKKF